MSHWITVCDRSGGHHHDVLAFKGGWRLQLDATEPISTRASFGPRTIVIKDT